MRFSCKYATPSRICGVKGAQQRSSASEHRHARAQRACMSEPTRRLEDGARVALGVGAALQERLQQLA
jgi:hypothetical protein